MKAGVPPLQVRACTRRLDFAAEPVSLFRLLTEDGKRPHCLMWESADPATRRPLRSLLVPAAALGITCRDESITLDALEPGGTAVLQQLQGVSSASRSDRLVLPCPPASVTGTDRERLQRPSALTPLRELMYLLRPERSDLPESVLLAGCMAYDLIDRFESLPPSDHCGDRRVPEYQMYLASRLVIIDHVTQQTEIIAVALDGDTATAAEAVATIVAAAHEIDDRMPTTLSPAQARLAWEEIATDCTDAEFVALVERCQRDIAAGEIFQIVPSRTFSLPCADAFLAYQHLRAMNPSPYLFYLNTGTFTLFGSSPESAVTVNGATRAVAITPIAGTRPRGLAADGGIDLELDARLETELRLDAKETAEHMMLVDLARNDVARISAPGTRTVAELMHVERLSHVMHLVSRVEGTLADELDALHACQAAMHAGTLTGAPKLRAMELLRQYESTPRGHYGGIVGYLQADGTLDTAIVIRAALVVNGTAQVRAGAGVVYDSVPQLEAEETRRKAEVVVQAIARANRTAAANAARATTEVGHG